MRREIDLKEISDGRLYTENDLVKAGCGDCQGCSACCRGMGTSIVLDPLDIFRLTTQLDMTFEQLLQKYVELNVVDGVILPNLKMTGAEEACAFLNAEGRCSIHPHRPGICRLFPLGRYYENHRFQYFLQIHECPKEPKTKVKVKKWIDTPELKKNEQFINAWHDFILEMQDRLLKLGDEKTSRESNLYLWQEFFLTPYEKERTFYEQFAERLARAKKVFR